jgi:hypothetical protein
MSPLPVPSAAVVVVICTLVPRLSDASIVEFNTFDSNELINGANMFGLPRPLTHRSQ